MKTGTIEIYSDLICPWCYIGQQKMREGLALLASGVKPLIIWKPFQLNPDVPIEGIDRKIYRSRKFGSWERSQSLDAGVVAAGKSVGLTFNYDRVQMTPNTFAGHRLLWWSASKEKQDQLAEALFRAYFTEGRDLGTHETLAAVAAETGLDKDEATRLLASGEGFEEVVVEEAEGKRLGIQGVPFFVVNGTPSLSGAQSPEAFAEVFKSAFSISAFR